MKQLFKLGKLYVPALVLVCSMGLTSCSDDDDNTPAVDVTTDEMFGNYEGKMFILTASPTEGEEGEEIPSGTDVLAEVNNDTIYFESFPIRDVVVSIVGEEMADKIVEAVGDIEYKVGYKAKLNEAQDSICFQLDPKPLKLAVSIPSEGEPLTLNIEVKVSPTLNGNYEVSSANQKFAFGAEEVAFVNGDERTPIEDFKPITFDFEMKKVKSE